MSAPGDDREGFEPRVDMEGLKGRSLHEESLGEQFREEFFLLDNR